MAFSIGYRICATSFLIALEDLVWVDVALVNQGPDFSPWITRRMLPLVRILKTMIGTWLSLEREMAVLSITANPCVKTSIYEISEYIFAVATFAGSAS